MNHVIVTGDQNNDALSSIKQADLILSEIGQLYRERFRALYSFDPVSVKLLGDQIDALKSKLAKL